MRPRDAGQLVVVEENDPSGLDQTAKVEKVDEYPVETEVSIDEREVEAPGFVEESGQHDLGLLRVVFHHLPDPRLIEDREACHPNGRWRCRHAPDVRSRRSPSATPSPGQGPPRLPCASLSTIPYPAVFSPIPAMLEC
jgi:hypothetical protein